MNIDTSQYYIIPKNNPLINEASAKLLTYATLYNNSLADENYDGLTNEAGLKLFITLDKEIAQETNLTAEQISTAITELQTDKLIRVINQPHGKPPVVFVESTDNTRTVNLTAENDMENQTETENDIPEPIYTPAETEIFGCWEEVFGNQPNQETKTKLSEYLTTMDTSLLMLAIYDSDSKELSVFQNLEAYKEAGYKSVDDFKQEEPGQNEAEEDITIYTPPQKQKPEQTPEEPKNDTTPAPATRKEALSAACDNTFKPTDINELWVSMQEVIDEDKWNDYTYLKDWLRERYLKMESIVKGGDRFVKMSKLQELIAES